MDKKQNSKQLINAIVKGIKEKKGCNIILMNLKSTGNSICDYFVVADVESSRQALAVTKEVERVVKEDIEEQLVHKEGLDNANWILLDYVDVVVHIFKTEFREFYKLEELWGDAKIQNL